MKRLLTAAVLWLLVTPGHAQTLDPNVFPIEMVSHVLKDMMLENAISPLPGRPPPAKLAAAGAVPPAAESTTTSVTTYRAAPAVTARAKRQFIDFIRRTGGTAAGQEMERVLGREDFVRAWSGVVADEGLKPGDLADVLAAYWMLNYLIANGLTDGPQGAGRAVAGQVRGVMAGNPALARLNEPQRQEFAEILMLNFLVQQAAYNDAVKTSDGELKRKLGEAATARFRNEMGLDLRRLELTPKGFVRRG